MAKRLRTVTIACEVTGINEFIEYPFNAYLRKHGFGTMIPLSASGDRNKASRIKALAPLYRMGNVYHHVDTGISEVLESQLAYFPRSRHLDVADAFAYSIKLFDLGDRTLMPDGDDDELLKEEEELLKEMYEEDDLEFVTERAENWRTV